VSPLELVRETVAKAIAAGRVGTPVSVRLVAHVTADHGEVDGVLAEALDAASGWLGAAAESVRASGGDETGETSVLVRFAGGQTALVSVGTRGESAPMLEVVLVGNRGVLAWEGDGGSVSADVRLGSTALPDKPAVAPNLPNQSGRITRRARKGAPEHRRPQAYARDLCYFSFEILSSSTLYRGWPGQSEACPGADRGTA
jgi:predicted dehydrogenase